MLVNGAGEFVGWALFKFEEYQPNSLVFEYARFGDLYTVEQDLESLYATLRGLGRLAQGFDEYY